MKMTLLLSASALALCCVAPAFAQTAAVAEAAVSTADNIDEIVVYGRGETRQVQTIQAIEILSAAPGTSPLKIISKLPSVNFQSADAYGAYEWAVRVSVRGFNQNQLGFTLDDVPLGDMSYGNHNGLHISRAIISENIGKVELAQGAGALDTASSSNLGGTLKFSSIAPSEKFGVLASVTAGSDSALHTFVRLETGTLPTGARGYISYADQSAEKWKGYGGEQKQTQINAKFVQPVGPVNLTAFINLSDRAENDYQDVSKNMVKRLGYNIDNIKNNWTLAKQIATAYQTGTAFPAPYTTVDDVYFDASGLRKDSLGGISADWEITKSLTAKATAYRHTNKGMGTWYTPYVPSPGGAPISERTSEYNIDRSGIVASLTYVVGDHTIEGGVWTEENDFHHARRFYGNSVDKPRDSLKFQSGPFFTQWEYFFNTKTTDFHLQDSWKVTDALKVNFGFKTVNVENNANRLLGTNAVGSIKVDENFLPQVGFNYDLGSAGEVFGSYAKNARAFVSSATSGPFSTSQAGFDAIKGKLQPELSTTFEGGYRFRNDSFDGVVAVYHVSFENRLLATSVGAAIVGNPSALANVGGVTSDGFEAAGTYRITNDWSVFGSYSYNKSTYDDDVRDGSGVITARTSGKEIVDAPKNLLKGELAYDNGTLFAKLGASYTDKRFYTYTSDASVDAFTVADLSVGYRFKSDNTLLNGLEVQGNVTNLFDKKYFSTVGSAGYGNSDPTGDGQTLMVGSPRQVFVTVRKQF
jgi:iron complex outermembrane receptor protein